MPKILSKCKYCNNEFKYHPSHSKGIYCSHRCQQDKRILKIMEGSDINPWNAKTYLKRFVKYECSECDISEWNGKPLTLQMDHIDGDLTNNKKENIRWLCPNCHTQTETWGVKNVSKEGKKRIFEGALKGNKIRNKRT